MVSFPMRARATKTQDLLSKWLRYLVIAVLAIGILLRFTNLDRKPFWFDETYTPLQSSGYTEREVVNHFSDSRIISVSDLKQYLHPDPNGSFTDTIKTFAVEDPQHPPLYYLMTRFWMQCFGSSATALRSLSTVLSLFTFPCIFWLCLELFGSPVVGWIAVCLVAVSPLNLLYAQEAREYTLWIVMTLFSSAALLRAMRLQTKAAWGLYSFTMAISLYSFIFSALVLFGHAVYILVVERFRFTKTVLSYFASSCLGILPFLPWVVVIVTNLSQIQATSVSGVLDLKVTPLQLVAQWLREIRLVFFDLNIDAQSPLIYKAIAAGFLIIFPLLVAFAFYLLCRHNPKRVWLLVLILTGSTFLPLAVLDIASGGIRSTIPRYVLPLCTGIQLAFAYFIANRLETAKTVWGQRLWCMFVATVLTCGIVSCALSTQAENWWIKGQTDFVGFTHAINQTERPLLIGNATLSEFLALSYKLDPKVKILMQPNCFNCNQTYSQMFNPGELKIPDGYSDIFAIRLKPDEWLKTFQNGTAYRAVPVTYKGKVLINYTGMRCWKLEKR